MAGLIATAAALPTCLCSGIDLNRKACALQALREDISADITRAAGEALLDRLTGLQAAFPGHQPLLCRKALLELRLSNVHAAASTLDDALASSSEMGPVRWASHLRAHVHWLLGQPDKVPSLASLLLLHSSQRAALDLWQHVVEGLAPLWPCLHWCCVFVPAGSTTRLLCLLVVMGRTPGIAIPHHAIQEPFLPNVFSRRKGRHNCR